MVGYFRATFFMTPTEKNQASRCLLDFAASNGYDMPRIFVEELPTAPAAFIGLLEAASSEPVAAVAVLSADALQPHQLARLASTGVTVLIADPGA